MPQSTNVFKTTISAFFVLFMVLSANNVILGQSGTIEITVEPGQNIRFIAEKYLGDPDLWNDILLENNLKSAADVTPGMTLRIPVKAIKTAIKELGNAQREFQEANKVGARIFATAVIDSGIVRFDQATENRRSGDWSGCFAMAKDAVHYFSKAYNICLEKKDVPGQATLNYKTGKVQNRKQIDPAWVNTKLGADLIEGEKVRTMSRSYAEILFLDESRLKLEENSQALIQEMRVNLLEKKNKSTVSLIQGDLYAMLSGQSGSQQFNLEVPGVETDIKSTNFRVGKDEDKARFANYEGEFGVMAAGEKVVLQANQGSVVEKNKKPTAPRDLLPKVTLESPAEESEVFDFNTPFSWQKLTGAKQYKIEIAKDKNFSQLVLNEKQKAAVRESTPELDPGVYFWRVLAYDNQDLAGQYSITRSFIVIKDNEPPYLVVSEPKDNAVIAENKVKFTGETEPSAKLTIDGVTVIVEENGKFAVDLELKPGTNSVILISSDRAGNESKLVKKVVFRAQGSSAIEFDKTLIEESPGVFLVKDRALTLKGTSDPVNEITIEAVGGAYSASAYADDDGAFTFNIPLTAEETLFKLESKAARGTPAAVEIKVKVDDAPPEIAFTKAIPSITGQIAYMLEGTVKSGNSLSINGKQVTMTGEAFKFEIALKSGPNNITVEAKDLVGNQTIVEKTVTLDQEPPRVTKHEIKPSTVSGGEQVQVFIYAEDESGLKKAATFIIKVGDFSYQGFLRYSRTAERYEGTVGIPAGKKGKVSVEIIIQDVHGNQKSYKF